MNAKTSAITLVLFLLLSSCTKESYDNWPAPQLVLEEVGECKQFGLKINERGSDQDCLELTHDGDSTLSVKHINAAFNCCPVDIEVRIEIKHDTLLIMESEREGLCDCDCLYDLNYEISPIPPKMYVVKVIEPLLRGEERPLMGTFDLSFPGAKGKCITRVTYPWGM